jgi:two-component system LytT family sensor kinase
MPTAATPHFGVRVRSSGKGRSVKHWATRIAIAVLVWSAIGAVVSLPYILLRGFSMFIRTMFEWWLWGALLPVMNAADERLSIAGKRFLPFLAGHAALGISLTALQFSVAATLEFRFGYWWNPWSDPLGALDHLLRNGLVYCLIFGALKGFKYYRRHHVDEIKLERLEQHFLETRLNALRMQLDPHFLFNSLNGISAYVGYEPKLARKMIEHLGDLLRLSLETRNRQEVTLADEISFLDHYLALHRMRFEDRLSFTVTVMADVEGARIPSLLLQPLVENAIRHGIAGRVTGGSIVVSARRVGGKVEIRVTDDGVGLPPNWKMEAAQGLGLSVTRERLLAMYPGGASDFTVAPHAGGGTEARISLPLAIA